MIPTFLITFREILEAALIVATILGILTKLKQHALLHVVWKATGLAALTSVTLLVVASILGVKAQELIPERIEPVVEGVLMTVSACFITWAIFFLHKHFGKYKTSLLQHLKATVELSLTGGLFSLVFVAVFREGFEVVLFLATTYLTTSPVAIMSGFAGGTLAACIIAWGLFTTTIRLPVYVAFRTTSILLILFAAGLLAQGAYELGEAGLMPMAGSITFGFLPSASSFAGHTIQSVFGITQHMDWISLSFYITYIAVMHWYVFVRKTA